MTKLMRLALWILVVSIPTLACGGGGSSTPTSSTPIVTTPPPVVTTTVTPLATPAPPATPYSGRWSGNYVIDRCDGTGSVQDLLCGTNRGLYPPGTSLPITLDLTQSGTATATITYWDTRASGSVMDGFFNFNAGYTNIPGIALVSARLGSVRK
ncbi:MAG: hypothetical protein WC815_16420 [Vicinamibacterales bacterium]|jgi:hypothetical protein